MFSCSWSHETGALGLAGQLALHDGLEVEANYGEKLGGAMGREKENSRSGEGRYFGDKHVIKYEGDGPMQQRGRETAPIVSSRLAHVFLHDRNPPADAEGEGGYFEAGGGLLSFVFVEVHFADHVVDHGLGKALGDQVATGEAFFHVAFEDRVEDVVGREAVLIHLARAEFGARGLFDGVERDIPDPCIPCLAK